MSEAIAKDAHDRLNNLFEWADLQGSGLGNHQLLVGRKELTRPCKTCDPKQAFVKAFTHQANSKGVPIWVAGYLT